MIDRYTGESFLFEDLLFLQHDSRFAVKVKQRKTPPLLVAGEVLLESLASEQCGEKRHADKHAVLDLLVEVDRTGQSVHIG